MPGLEITLPNQWQARPYQIPLWRFLREGGKRAVAVWHRRAGKDDIGLHWTCVALHKRVATYWHMLPEASQARKAIWEAINPHTGIRRINEAFPLELREVTRENEMLIRFKCGSTWQVVGSDNYDSLMGAPPVGIVFSEYAISKPAAWDFLRPILRENNGWALFIYTARGQNHGADLYNMALANPDWFCERLTVADTGNVALADAERKDGMSESMIQQEYYCSFDAAVVGSYYGELLGAAEIEKRIGFMPYDAATLVTTAWDLGYGDDTSIWFAQLIGKEVRLIDYYENRGVGLDHYSKILNEKPYSYTRHLLPHDGSKGELIAGTTIIESAQKLLGKNVEVLPRISVEDGINAARVLLPRCTFDATRCAAGLKALRLYRRAYDENRKVFSDKPLHDWTSHAADAFRYLAMGLKEPPTERKPREERGDIQDGWMA